MIQQKAVDQVIEKENELDRLRLENDMALAEMRDIITQLQQVEEMGDTRVT